MVRKKQSPSAERISVDSLGLEELVEFWLQKIRALLPEGAAIVSTVHKLPRHKYLVSFRASAFGETFISEVREETLEAGVREAGARLCERLSLSPPRPKENLGEKVRRKLFGGDQAAS